MEVTTFHWFDYLTFVAMLFVSAAIGLAFSRKAKAKSAGGIFVGGRKMTLLPVTLSAFATFMSAVGILGGPLEVYYHGLAYAYLDAVGLISTATTCFIFIPFYYHSGFVSIYEYLRLRFNSTVAMLAALIAQLGLFLYMSVVLYAPSSAFSQISGLPLWVSILCVGAVCTIYTAFGGLQGVMWTDVWQTLFMFAGMLTIIIVGTVNVGGPEKVVEAAIQGGRFDFRIETYPNPLIRHSILSVMFGGGFFLIATVSSQPLFQRYVSCKNLRTAQVSSWFTYLANLTFGAMVNGVGLVCFAYFSCDPLITGEIKKSEQLVTYTVLKTMGIPGIAGLFLACTFSGALSTISSVINSISLVVIVDFIGPIRKSLRKQPVSNETVAKLSKIIALIVGMLMVGMAFLCDKLDTLILQITMSIGGMTMGPCFGLVMAAMFMPFVNSAGATCGFVASSAVSIFIGVGSAVTGISSYAPKLPLSTHGCVTNGTDGNSTYGQPQDIYSMYQNQTQLFWSNETSQYSYQQNYTASVTTQPVFDPSVLWFNQASDIFRISYLLYCFISTTICLVVASLVSLCTNCNKYRPMDRRLFFSCTYTDDSFSGKSNYSSRMTDDEASKPLNRESNI